MRRLIPLLTLAVTGAAALSAYNAQATTRPSIPSGKVEAHMVFDSTYKRQRRIWVYTPPITGYDVGYTEARGGNHAPQWWKTRLADGIALISAGWAASTQGKVSRTPQTSNTNALLIAVSPVNDRVVWASGAQGTYVRTLDGGATWQAARVPGADSLQFRDVHAVDANTAYLLSIGNGNQSRIYKTTDAGAHWTLQYTNPDSAGFYDCMDFWDARRGIVIGDALGPDVAMLRTTDGGAHWTRISPASLPRAQPNEGSFAASGTCLVTKPGGHGWAVASNADHGRVLHTADYGATWSVDTLPLTTRAGSGPQSIAFRDARHGMALGGGTSAQPGDRFTATTSDAGKTWVTRTSVPLRTGVWGGVYVPNAASPTVVAVGPAGAVWSNDEGATWTPIDTLNYWSVGFASPRAGWAVGTQGKITKLSGF